MLNLLLEKCGCIGNSTSVSALIDIESLDIKEVIPPNKIKIVVELKFNLNCTSMKPGDCIYLMKKESKSSENILKGDVFSEYLYFQLILKLKS